VHWEKFHTRQGVLPLFTALGRKIELSVAGTAYFEWTFSTTKYNLYGYRSYKLLALSSIHFNSNLLHFISTFTKHSQFVTMYLRHFAKCPMKIRFHSMLIPVFCMLTSFEAFVCLLFCFRVIVFFISMILCNFLTLLHILY